MNEQDFHDYHLMLDERAEQMFGVTCDVGERAHKIDGTTRCSVSKISERQRLRDKSEERIAEGADE